MLAELTAPVADVPVADSPTVPPVVPENPNWHLLPSGGIQVDGLTGSVLLKRSMRTDNTPWPKLEEIAASYAATLKIHPAVTKLAIADRRLAEVKDRVEASKRELAEAERCFAAQLTSADGDNDGADVADARRWLADQERLLSAMLEEHAKLKAPADAAEAACRDAVKQTQLNELRKLEETAKVELVAALSPILDKVFAIVSARKRIMFGQPLPK